MSCANVSALMQPASAALASMLLRAVEIKRGRARNESNDAVITFKGTRIFPHRLRGCVKWHGEARQTQRSKNLCFATLVYFAFLKMTMIYISYYLFKTNMMELV